MNVLFSEVTRGTARIFVRLVVEGASGKYSLAASSECANGPLPAQIYKIEGDEWVLVLPVVNLDQDAAVSVLGADSKVLGIFEKTFVPSHAKLKSQLNTLFHNKRATDIRNYDDTHELATCRILIDRMIADYDQTTIVHGSVQLLYPKEVSSKASIQIHVLNTDGVSLTNDKWVLMGDAYRSAERSPLLVYREISFSFRIAASDCEMIVWVTDANGVIPDGFRVYDPLWMQDTRLKRTGEVMAASVNPQYDHWFTNGHKTLPAELEVQRGERFDINPMFSLIVPLYKTPLDYFRVMLDSVLDQTYGNWELLLVNASPEDGELFAKVEEAAKNDSRVKHIVLKENDGITGNTNEGIRAATGDFVSFLDHDDFIEPDLLYCYVKGINDYPETDLLYCDEDQFDDEEKHFRLPFFKPDWSPDLLMCKNYITHMLTIRKTVLNNIAPLPREFDGAQDYYMTLRASEVARNIYHARKILYHWRACATSTSKAPETKLWAVDAGKKALQGHLDRCHIKATAMNDEQGIDHFTYYLSYEYESEPLVSIVIPNKDLVPVLSRCIDSIYQRTSWKNYEIIIVENNSVEDETFAYYKQLQDEHDNLRVITVEMNGMFNFSRLINAGFAEAKGEYLLMLNNDTEVIEPKWIDYMVGPCQRPEVGVVGTKLLYPDGTIQHAGVAFHKFGPAHIGQYLPHNSVDAYGLILLCQDMTAVTGACLLTKRSVFDELGGLDEEAFAIDYNDVDYCCRARKAGYLVVYQPLAVMHHYESVSRGDHGKRWKARLFRQEQGRMMDRYPDYYEFGDPYLNPNLLWGGVYRQLA